MKLSTKHCSKLHLPQGLKHAARGYFMRLVLLFGSFQIINIQLISFIHRCLKVLGQRVNNFLSNERRYGWK